ncbi:TetR/AcrR family transcriptional regulator [Undibacter mobilis]|uniref:TetR/AcrR family transcriptional regulator n=1 Tax=Undibacter mobilis TaxID=2292256 RepID=A0A371B3D3_9BRAD|nr:TetR/AcrR family transcriptional regulator [Undibacter mobilis]
MATMGRPREFDTGKALDKALDVFWRHGYEGASISELTHAMGISPPSLYAAFGNKEKLFHSALDRYAEVRKQIWAELMKEPTARAMMERLFDRVIEFYADEGNPNCCMLVKLSTAESDKVLAEQLCAKRAEAETMLIDRFSQAKTEGELPGDIEPADLAGYFMTVLDGLSVRAAAGAGREELHKVANLAMRGWPSP